MPDLSQEAATKYWSEYIDPMIYRVLIFLESVEHWTLDHSPVLEEAMHKLGDTLEDIHSIDLSKLSHEDTIIRVVANIKSTRGLRLLQALDSVHPGSASRILMHAERNTFSKSDPSGVFLSRNMAFERLRLLGRVFSEYRLHLIAKALTGEE
ncbi:MAG: type IVB secretion system protein IcmW [Legionellaceae bacterium]|nr:type IVB secretion system protein IcmW [Legionellaceae bacterium]